MPSLLIDPEILAQRLELAAARLEENGWKAIDNQNTAHLCLEYHQQAQESRQWAVAIRGANTLGWEGSHIEVGF